MRRMWVVCVCACVVGRSVAFSWLWSDIVLKNSEKNASQIQRKLLLNEIGAHGTIRRRTKRKRTSIPNKLTKFIKELLYSRSKNWFLDRILIVCNFIFSFGTVKYSKKKTCSGFVFDTTWFTLSLSLARARTPTHIRTLDAEDHMNTQTFEMKRTFCCKIKKITLH